MVSDKYKIIIINNHLYKEVEIPPEKEKLTIGTESNCEIRLPKELFFEKIELTFQQMDEVWNITCCENLYFTVGDIRKLMTLNLKHGDEFSVRYQESSSEVVQITFLIDFESEQKKYERKIDLMGIDRFTIGSADHNNIILKSKYTNNELIQVTKSNQGLFLDIKQSKYGVYVNGNKAEGNITVEDGSFFSISNFSFYYKNEILYTQSNPNCTIRQLTYKDDKVLNYPRFNRNTRIKDNFDDTSIQILDPADVPTKPELNIVTSLMPTIVMFALVVVLRGVMSTSGGTFILFSICSMGMGVVTSVLSILDKKKKYKKDCATRISKYQEYIKKKTEEIETARQEEKSCMQGIYYDINKDLEHIEQFSPALFDRIPEDDDFLDIYIGTGRVEAKKKIDYKAKEKMEYADELAQIPNELSSQYRYIENAPVVLPLKEANAIGVIGNKVEQYEMFKCFVVDLICRQYYGDVKLYTLIDKYTEQYDWLRMVPHINSGYSCRNIVCDSESKNTIFESLYKELSERSKAKNQTGFNVILILNDHGMKNHPLSKFIENAASLNTVFIFFEEQKELLPLYCSSIIQLYGNNQGELIETSSNKLNVSFEYQRINDDRIHKAVTYLTPVYCDEISLDSALRKSISLFELLGIYAVDDLNLTERWKKSKIYDTIAVPLGVNVKNDIVYLDIHEKYHGPHGLVAGTTGSGKSEILQTYILGAATLFHPYEIGFVIIDFKGGGMVNQFRNLPHLIGAITNIDGKAIDRSLKSIKAELLKRQALFAEADVNHIDKYIKAYKSGKVKSALPHLVIIVDEFAELKAEQPEFMKELISAARIGRSLGVHLILATQKPAGQVNEQIWSNSKFKLCLKVQTQEDSNEVLKSPLAAEIREPGRAYLQVGNNEMFELLQSGYSGAPEKTDNNEMKSYIVNELDFKGNKSTIYSQKPNKSTSARTQLEAIVDYVNSYCTAKGIQHLQEICLPALSDKIIYQQGKENCGDFQINIGIYDDPDHQYQGNAYVDVGLANMILIGSSQFGKTNLLETIIRNIADRYSPDEINIYIIDFGSMVLKNFEKLAHVGGVVCPSDDEKLKNLFKYLNDQVVLRREKMLSVGVSSFSSYRDAGYRDLPQIMVLVDNFTALKELYLQDNDFLLKLCREGISVGISFVIANAQTNGLGYKYMSNFSTRVALFCNEPSEYSTLFGSCHIRPDEVPGRGLVEIDKSIYECQTYLAFDGEREIDRVEKMHDFITSINMKYAGKRAVPIPEIPDVLSEEYLSTNFVSNQKKDDLILGLNYDSVAPLTINMQKTNLLALTGAEDSGQTNFIKYLIHAMCQKKELVNLYIFDDFRRKLASESKGKDNIFYEIGSNQCKDIMVKVNLFIQEQYQKMIAGDELSEKWNIFVFNNEDVVNAISNDKDLINQIKDFIKKYKMLHIFILIGHIPNAAITYNSLEVLKIVKENKNILFFDNLDNCKIVDIPLAYVRNNKKRITTGDAFYICGNECSKVKTPYASQLS